MEINKVHKFALKISNKFSTLSLWLCSGKFKIFNSPNFKGSKGFCVKSREVKLFWYVFRMVWSIYGVFFSFLCWVLYKNDPPN